MSLGFISERTFAVNGLNFAAKEWGTPGAMPVIALHGWLDNAASFDAMLPHMENLHVIALDCAGHGNSSFRSADAGYNIWQDIGEVMAIANQLGWQRFALLGHSRGAIISSLIAGTFPDRISRVALIDGHIPSLAEAQGTALQLAQSLSEHRRYSEASPSFFHSFERAVQARVNGFAPLQESAATLLAERGVREESRGFYWHNDQRLKAASEIKLTREHLKDFHGAITAQVLLIQAEDSPFSSGSTDDESFSWVASLELLTMPGSHHLHMEDQAQQVAEKVQSFFSAD
ncbi:MAG: alpha/beta fold hydrolase [Porticoccaceae bacterium]